MHVETVEKVTERGLFRGIYKDLQHFRETAFRLSKYSSA
jgi:hypothetical protein